MPDLHKPAHLPPLGPCTHLVTVVPDDERVYDPPLRVLWIGGVGDITLLADDDEDPVQLTTVPAGVTLEMVLVRKVMATGTTIRKLVGAY